MTTEQTERTISTQASFQVWQPIETAPRDKTILVFGQPTDVEGVRFSMPFVCTAYWDDIDSSFCLTGASWLGPFIRPKFWMPLPKPPDDSLVLKKDERSEL